MREEDGVGYVKKNEFSREAEGERTPEREREREKRWEKGCENAQWKPPSPVPVGRNFSHKELPRVFIRPENLMRSAAPQLKRAADPHATCHTRARDPRSSFVVELVPDYLLSR